jgi:predicted helicase
MRTKANEDILWREVLKENLYVVCMSPMAVHITNRVLRGNHTDWHTNVCYIDNLTNKIKEDIDSVVSVISNSKTFNDNNSNSNMKFTAIVGNPPYVEYGKLPVKPNSNYGNIYADILCNAVCELKSTGLIGFVIPLSFVATSRMQSIREDMYKKMHRIFILNYADRPDCLFDGVHQKLSILFGIKGQGN